MNKKLFTSATKKLFKYKNNKIVGIKIIPFDDWNKFNVNTAGFETLGSINRWNNFNISTQNIKTLFGYNKFHTSQKVLKLSSDANVHPSISKLQKASWDDRCQCGSGRKYQRLITELNSENKRFLIENQKLSKNNKLYSETKKINEKYDPMTMIDVVACTSFVLCGTVVFKVLFYL